MYITMVSRMNDILQCNMCILNHHACSTVVKFWSGVSVNVACRCAICVCVHNVEPPVPTAYLSISTSIAIPCYYIATTVDLLTLHSVKGMLELIKHTNKWLFTSNCHFNATFCPSLRQAYSCDGQNVSGLLNNLLCVCIQGLFVRIFEVCLYICVHFRWNCQLQCTYTPTHTHTYTHTHPHPHTHTHTHTHNANTVPMLNYTVIIWCDLPKLPSIPCLCIVSILAFLAFT